MSLTDFARLACSHVACILHDQSNDADFRESTMLSSNTAAAGAPGFEPGRAVLEAAMLAVDITPLLAFADDALSGHHAKKLSPLFYR